MNEYFPQGIAFGQAFLGRETEKKWLEKNINHRYHTVIVAPRRFGKTSLVLNVLNKLKLPYSEVNFHLIVSEKSVEKKIIDAILKIINQFVSTPEYKLKVIRSFFARAKKKWTIGFKDVIGLELEPSHDYSSSDNIYTALLLLDDLLAKKKSKSVIFIDEIQELTKIDESFQIEGALRDFAQRSKNITFVFSGSSRSLLIDMFNNRSKPLYELCDQMTLGKIPEDIYIAYFIKVSKTTWGKALNVETMELILKLTKCHPRRVYNLCFYLWRMNEDRKKVPGVKEVVEAWDCFITNRLKNTREALSSLSKGQIKLLTYIAMGNSEELTGQLAQRSLNLASSSITRFLKKLEEKDYIETINNASFIVDSLVEEILKKHEGSMLAN